MLGECGGGVGGGGGEGDRGKVGKGTHGATVVDLDRLLGRGLLLRLRALGRCGLRGE